MIKSGVLPIAIGKPLEKIICTDEKINKYYIGHTCDDIQQRLRKHNLSITTSIKKHPRLHPTHVFNAGK
ncbi:MAG: hypothetical protein EA358_07020 [Flavobacteriales bacterium]|nr:MAG: hypothetical protein EA358_07020 [Flavobacteriales bacterium]